jgi:hypothetical protein
MKFKQYCEKILKQVQYDLDSKGNCNLLINNRSTIELTTEERERSEQNHASRASRIMRAERTESREQSEQNHASRASRITRAERAESREPSEQNHASRASRITRAERAESCEQSEQNHAIRLRRRAEKKGR